MLWFQWSFIVCSTTNKLEGYLDVSFVIYLMVCVCTRVHVWRPGTDDQRSLFLITLHLSVCFRQGLLPKLKLINSAKCVLPGLWHGSGPYKLRSSRAWQAFPAVSPQPFSLCVSKKRKFSRNWKTIKIFLFVFELLLLLIQVFKIIPKMIH